MTSLTNARSSSPPAAPHVTPKPENRHPVDNCEQLFDPAAPAVLFRAVRAVPDTVGGLACWRSTVLAAVACSLSDAVVVEWTVRRGDWRRERVCQRCLDTFLRDELRRDADSVVVWFPSEAADVLDGPPAPGAVVEWPAEMPRSAA